MSEFILERGGLFTHLRRVGLLSQVWMNPITGSITKELEE